MDDDNILLELASKGYARETSTIRLSRQLGLSQQSVSRRLIEIEGAGLIKRQSSPQGMRIEITPAGKELLRLRHRKLSAVIRGSSKISGKLVSSLGEGAYYMSQKGYLSKIKKELGFIPYPGTLNLETDDLPIGEPVEIPGFTTKERTFGPLKCYPIKIGDTRGAVVVPARTHHRGILEVITPVALRKKLRIKDGDTVELEEI